MNETENEQAEPRLHPERKKCIGASEVGAVLGLSKWASPYDVWASKTIGRPREEMSQAAELGLVLEDSIGAYAAKKLNAAIDAKQVFRRHGVYDWMGATIDFAAHNDERAFLIDCKATKAEYWSEIPLMYQCQMAWQCFVHGYDVAYVATLHASTSFEAYEFDFHRDAKWFPDVFEACQAWWKRHVIEGEPPNCLPRMDIVQKIKAASGKRIEMTADDRFMVAEIVERKAKVRELELEIEQRKTLLQQRLGDAEIGEYEGVPIVTWKQTKDRIFFDSLKFKAENPELFSKYCERQEGSRQFLPKLKMKESAFDEQ